MWEMSRRDGSAPRPSGPPGRFLVGNLQDYEEDRLGFLMAARARYGGLVAFDTRTTIVNDPGLARGILKARDGEFQIRDNFLQHRLSDVEIGDTLRARQLLNPGLRRTAVATAAPYVARTTRGVLDRTGARHVDPVPLMEEITSRTIADHYFGRDGRVLPAAVGALLDALSVVIGNPLALPPGCYSPARRRIRAAHRELKELVVPLLRLRDAQPHGADDVASQVVRARDPDAGQSVERIADLLIGAMLAAHRVPAASAAWMLMLVADRPELPGRLAEEAARFGLRVAAGASGGERPERYPFATACVHETLRLYPATWLLDRVAARQVPVAGFAFAAGHHFLISPYVLQRDETSFESAEQFRPDRWAGRSPSAAGGFMAFGHGQHACPGSNFAVTVLTAILLTVVGGWRVDRLPTTVTANARTTLLPDGLRLSFRARSAQGAAVPLAGAEDQAVSV